MIRFRRILLMLVCLVCFQAVDGAWTKQNSGTLAWLHDVYFFDEHRGFVAGGGGTFLETRDGGKTWSKRKNFTADKILQIYFADHDAGWLLCERDPFSGGATAVSYLMKTTDGGANWERVEFKDAKRTRLTKIFFNQKGKGFGVGESGAFFELNARGEWERAPSPIRYLLLDGAFFGDGGGGALVGAGGSVYFTEDGGASWNPGNVFGESTAKLNALFFADRKNGWAVGAQGRILQTASGGRTWREQTSGVSANLRGVFFKNASEGWAVGDEGVLLRTDSGGNAWTPEETKIRHRLEKILFVGKKGFAVGFGGTILVSGESDSEIRTAVRPALQKRNQ